MTQEEFDQYINAVKTLKSQSESQKDTSFMLYSCIVSSLKDSGYTRLYEGGRYLEYPVLDAEKIQGYEVKMLLSQIQKAFGYTGGFETKSFRDHYTAFIWNSAANDQIKGAIIDNDVKFE